MDIENDSARSARIERRHLIQGWAGLFVFTILGVGLEFLLAYKVPLYVDADSESRRSMWRLAHAHGTLFALVNLAYSWTVTQLSPLWAARNARSISRLLTLASVTVPIGFFLAGIGARGADPGAEIALVPAGAVAFLIATAWITIGLFGADKRTLEDGSDAQSSSDNSRSG